MTDDQPPSARDGIDAAIARSDELVRVLDREVEFLRARDYDGLRELNAHKESLEAALTSLTEAGLSVGDDAELAQRVRAAQERLAAALERNRRINAAHQDAVGRLLRVLRESSAEAEDAGLYTEKPGRQPRTGRHGTWRDV
jgi:flagellar biosynthesis/type III secretory pathway chaperone